ncbi:MAG: hypothetical protein KC431_19440, partial [Myxococcales bacterium]|nr:hypothetical protein [Myxococcales bacterium]
GDPGDGDGDPLGCSVDYELGSQIPAFADGYLDPEADARIDFSCFGPQGAGEQIISWTAPASGEYYAYVEGEFAPELLFTRGGCDPDASFDCVPPFEPLQFYAELGQLFTFVIQDIDAFGGYWFFGIESLGGPSGCPDGFIEPGLPALWSGTTVGAGNDFRSECGGEEAPDRSYLFFPEVTGIYRLDTFGSDFDTVVHVYEGECNDGFQIACNDDNVNGGLESEVEFEMFAGQIYTLVIDGFGAAAGSFSAQLSLVAQTGCPEVFDVLPSVVPLVEAWELGDAFPAAPMYTCGPLDGQRRLLWEAPAAGEYRFSTIGSEAPTSLLLFDGGLCEDNVGFDCLPGNAPQGATIERFVEAGEVVDIVVSHPFQPGIAQLTIEPTLAPACDPTELVGPLPISVQGQTSGPSQWVGTCSDGGANAPEAVYSFTAPTADIYRFTTSGSTYDTIMYMRDAICGGQEMCDDDNGPGLTSRIDRMMAQGQTVTIFVDGYGQGQGNYTLTVSQL